MSAGEAYESIATALGILLGLAQLAGGLLRLALVECGIAESAGAVAVARTGFVVAEPRSAHAVAAQLLLAVRVLLAGQSFGPPQIAASSPRSMVAFRFFRPLPGLSASC